MNETIKRSLVLTSFLFFFCSLPVSIQAESLLPHLTVKVQNEAGVLLPLGGQIEMRDGFSSSGIVRGGGEEVRDSARFGPADFEGFVLSGINESGEEEQMNYPSPNLSRLTKARFKVRLTLNAEGYLSQTVTLDVPVNEVMEYLFIVH